MDKIKQELEGRATLPGTGGKHRPDTLAPATACFTPRSLPHARVDDHETSRLFGQIVRRLDPWSDNKAEVCLAVSPKPFGQVTGMCGFRYLGNPCLRKKTIDVEGTKGQFRGETVLGILSLSGDTLGRNPPGHR